MFSTNQTSIEGGFTVRNIMKLTALAAAMLGLAGPAMADNAETKGGLTIKTDDGRFEAKLGGRIHFDANLFVDDDDLGSPGETSSTFFRRTRLTMEGKLYGWKYKFEEDFAGTGGTAAGIREMWLGTSLGGANLRIGQAKPYRGMEELTSSNEVVFMERPYATATGLYDGRQFAQGLFLDGHAGMFTWGVAGYNLRTAAATSDTEGMGSAVRLTFAPVATDTAVVHIGLTGSVDNPDSNAAGVPLEVEVGAKPAGRLSSTEDIVASTNAQTTFGMELAGKVGPFYLQGEGAQATFDDEPVEQEVMTYYVQTSLFLTGESKPYDAKKGVFKSPKPKGGAGAVELKARYDFIENKDVQDLEVSQAIVGANWYVNPNVRFMLEYIMGTNEFDTAADGSQGVDISTVAARAQVNF